MPNSHIIYSKLKSLHSSTTGPAHIGLYSLCITDLVGYMPHPAHSKLIIDGLTNTRCIDAVDDNLLQNNNKK